MAKADKNGVYVLNGTRYQINEGDVLPEGAEMVEDEPVKESPESRKKGPAPENRAKKAE